MMSLLQKLAALLLFVSPLLRLHLLAHAASTSPPVTRKEIKYITIPASNNGEDYDEDYADSHSSSTKVVASIRTPLLRGEPQLCDYNPCSEDQEPCDRLATLTGCLCPGISAADVPPHPPRIQALLLVSEGQGRGKVEVQWCAPSSVVTQYKVVVEGHDSDPLEFGHASRRGLVGSLEVGAKVCVEAMNGAGHSAPTEFSCQRYDPPVSTDHKMLVGIIGGAIAVFLILIIGAVIILKSKVCRKAKRDSTDGLGNPSYSRGGTL
ncbi:LRRN4 C-terminal-like protein [Salarias fasciatus]|uniref:LRRN4 C-terminal-like protein n=1 Tax=Salarias fasciatus TaxID=181472 RepID=A0A672J239_SALFA|nr:LRRN4 C-terminal-like protein [Salarias fasciatus]